MKKIFTCLAIAAMTVSAVSANAEGIKISLTGYTWDYDANKELSSFASTINTELVNNGDGSYTIPDFLNSGWPVSFKFSDSEAMGDGAAITITSSIDIYGEGYEDLPYLMAPNGDSLELAIATTDNNTVYVYDPYIYIGTSSYSSIIYGYPNGITDNGKTYKYWAYFSLAGYDDEDNDAYLDLEFYFGDMAEDSAVSEISADKNAPVEYYNMNGLRVENPTNGLYIRRQGGEVKKVMVK